MWIHAVTPPVEQGGCPHFDPGIQADVAPLPAVQRVQVPLGDVVERHEHAGRHVLHHGGQSTVALRSAAAECQPPTFQPPGVPQRGMRRAPGHLIRVERGGVCGVEGHGAMLRPLLPFAPAKSPLGDARQWRAPTSRRYRRPRPTRLGRVHHERTSRPKNIKEWMGT